MKAILIDVTKCKGCMACVKACVKAKGNEGVRTSMGEAALSATQLSTVVPLPGGGHAKKSCMHCLEPNCVAACLVGGIERTPEGPVVYDGDKCIGCRYCMLACPFHIPRYEWQSTEPLMQKCDMCHSRVDKGEVPACVSACTHEALEFGEREALIQEAHSRIESHPSRYRNHLWGETEWGGTSLLYLSSEELDALGWPAVETDEPISALTDPLIHATPVVGLSVLLGSWGLGAIIQRRIKLMAPKKADTGEGTADQEDDDAE
jgi:formate dehydrogenase iron-sulfur subunit